ncbi:hypothetical protein GUA87_06130 [Sneathiella sp. P13V-1]|uniref:hypothetical protein n=1 Tax=Sneathiella sp. P13V-1 TaxID=2697366 RepID=UPI00187B99A8|nr:hypothetical protein [Sneathiella sp. P13V-1]MBE7636416.1 hypothetical protein [Sneathiella sp. P13V-1]
MNLKKMAIAGLALFVVVAGGGSYWFLKSKARSFETVVQQQLAQATGRNVQLEDVSFDMASTTGRIGKLKIYDSVGADKPLFTFSDVTVDIVPNTIFMGVVRVRSITASAIAVNISGNGARVLDLAKSATNASKNISTLASKPLVIVESVSFPAGVVTVGGSMFGMSVEQKFNFAPLKMAALGESSGGQPLPRILNQITGNMTGRVLSLPHFRSILR